MRRFFKTTTMALAFMLYLSMLILAGTAFAERCVDNGDGTVTDNRFGLMWQKATTGEMDWDTARRYCLNLSLAGHSGWRLPYEHELVHLYYNGWCKGLIDVRGGAYWTSSRSDKWGDIMVIIFSSGHLNGSDKSHSYYVRAVREAQ